MRTSYLTLCAALLAGMAHSATIPESRYHVNLDVPSVPELHEKPGSWLSRVRNGLSEVFLGKSSNNDPENIKHLAYSSSLVTKYAGDVVLRFNLSSVADGKAMADASRSLFLDVWSSTRDHVDIRIAEDLVPSLLSLLPESLQDAHARLMPDLGRAAQNTFPSAHQPNFDLSLEDNAYINKNNIFFHDYQPLSSIVNWMKLLESLFPSYVSLISLGQSYEGREIHGLRIGLKPAEGHRKRSIILTGAAHSREWISVSTVSYIAYSLITGYRKDKEITALLHEFDWILIPTLNVDGYAYTWEHDRLWRKNRQPTSLSFCQGIDLDRSYGVYWETRQPQPHPCSDNFPGGEAFEAIESRKLAEWMTKMTVEEGLDFVGYLDFHSYSQQILYPYSYSCGTTPPDLENLEELGMGLAKAIRLKSGEHYEVTSACDSSGRFSQAEAGGGGSALDYMYTHHVPYAYQIKLRDTGSYGFLLPRENIIPTGEESLGVIKYFGEFLSLGRVRSKTKVTAVPSSKVESELK